jgi:hypothetical protein
LSVYKNAKILGPYKSKTDKRSRVVVVLPSGKRLPMSYVKYLAEKRLGRRLKSNETVDHKDGNKENDDIKNLRVRDRAAHASLDIRRLRVRKFTCPNCRKGFKLKEGKLSDAIKWRNKGKVGPFCSRNCAGKYGKNVQMGSRRLIPRTIKPRYTSRKKEALKAALEKVRSR